MVSVKDPDIYKAVTLVLLTLAVIGLFLDQICRSKFLERYGLCWKEKPQTNDAKKFSVQSTSCHSSSRSQTSRRDTDIAEETGAVAADKVHHDVIAAAVPMERNARQSKIEAIETEGDDPEKIEIVMEKLIEDRRLSAISVPSAALKGSPNQDILQGILEEDSGQSLERENSLQRRNRRSAVCLSMPCGQSLPETRKSPTKLSPIRVPKLSNMEGIGGEDRGAIGVPELQVNGQSCEDGDPGAAIPVAEVKDDKDVDEGQIQCLVKYDEQKSLLVVHSVYVTATLDPGVPGFLVEVTILPRHRESVKSNVYLSAGREVDIEVKEVFSIQCSREDTLTNSLLIAVRPMFSRIMLYAETELNDLSLTHDNEVMLGGNLKSLAV